MEFSKIYIELQVPLLLVSDDSIIGQTIPCKEVYQLVLDKE